MLRVLRLLTGLAVLAAGVAVTTAGPAVGAPSVPLLSGLWPGEGPIAGGTLVTIDGSGFTGATDVRFGPTSATFTVLSDTEILATAPPAAAPVSVPVIVAAGPVVSPPNTFSGEFSYYNDGGQIEGTVTDANGVPIPGILPAVDFAPGGGDPVSDARGRYIKNHVPPGTYTVWFSGGDISTKWAKQWYNEQPTAATATPIVMSNQVATHIDARLLLAGTITGTVQDTSGGHPSTIAIAYPSENPTHYGWTSPSGAYTIAGLTPGLPYTVKFQSASYLDQWFSNQPTQATATPVTVTAGGTTSGVDATLQPGPVPGAIDGTVLGSGGVPLANIQVDAGSPGVYGSLTHTAADGTFHFGGVPAGSYKLSFTDPSHTYPDQWYQGQPDLASATPVAVTGGATTTLTANLLPGGTIAGTVRDASGARLPGITVNLFKSGPYHWQVATTTTSSQGTYSFADLLGPYAVEFVDPTGSNYIQWFDGKGTQASADTITVGFGDAKKANAQLVAAPPTRLTCKADVSWESSPYPETSIWGYGSGTCSDSQGNTFSATVSGQSSYDETGSCGLGLDLVGLPPPLPTITLTVTSARQEWVMDWNAPVNEPAAESGPGSPIVVGMLYPAGGAATPLDLRSPLGLATGVFLPLVASSCYHGDLSAGGTIEMTFTSPV